MVSFYWAVVTMATLGFGDIKPYTTHEIVMVIICLTAGAGYESVFLYLFTFFCIIFRFKSDFASSNEHQTNNDLMKN